jgi:hypothetical protein
MAYYICPVEAFRELPEAINFELFLTPKDPVKDVLLIG